jgi:hypothetical protein
MPDDPISTIEPGIVQRILYAATGAWQIIRTGKIERSWFGPLSPIPPMAPPSVAGRQFDFPVGVNLRIRPRESEGVSFPEMRGIADTLTLLRVAIETRKDQLVKLKYVFRPKDKQAKGNNSHVNELIEFFHVPDKEHTWQQWLRMLVEDMLVIDATTLYPRLNKGGGLYALEPIDGATIKRVINHTGRTPHPPEPAYQQILKGLPAIDYTLDELIYYPRNCRSHKIYGFSPVEQCILIVNIALRRDISQLQYYTEGNIPDAFGFLPPEWTPDQIAQFQSYWDSVLEGDTAARRHMKFLPGGTGARVDQLRDPKLKDEYDEWLARIICYCFSLPPTALIRQTNRNVAETVKETAAEEGLTPLMIWVADLINHVVLKYFKFNDVEFAWEEDEATDPVKLAQTMEIRVRNGISSLNKAREIFGEEPDPNGNELLVYTASGPVKLSDIISGVDVSAGNGGNGKAALSPKQQIQEKLAKAKKKVFRSMNLNRMSVIRNTRKLKKAYTKFFKTAGSDISAQLSRAIESISKADEDTVKKILDELNFEGWTILTDVTEEVLHQIYREAALHGIKNLVTADLPIALGEEGLTDLVNDSALDYARARAAEMVGKRWVDGKLVDNPNPQWAITESTRDELRSMVEKAIDEGWSPRHLSDEIETSGLFGEDRAEMIARTEIKIADSKGNMESYKESGLDLEKQWQISADHVDEDDCDENESEDWIDMNDVFMSGDDSPPLHPNCMCSLGIRVKGMEE